MLLKLLWLVAVLAAGPAAAVQQQNEQLANKCDVEVRVVVKPQPMLPGEDANLVIAPTAASVEDCVAQITTSDAYLDVEPKLVYFPAGSVAPVTVNIHSHYAHAGSVRVDAEDGRRLAEVQVTVITSRVLAGLSSLIGWAYFACWSISFYPQMWENYARQSVVGLNFDFLWLNLTGWVCYTAYNVGLYCVPAIQRQYAAKHPGSEISVLPNDVFFAIHALIVTVATIYQTYIYESGGQRVSGPVRMKLYAVGTLVLVLGVLCVTRRIDALTMLTGLSLIKLAISTVKYIPQAHMNYTRQSTEGWSIGNVLLDFAGGVLSVTQMLIIAYNADDYSGFYGNPTKFLLGQVSVVFDVLFMLQHYVWYPQTTADKGKAKDRDPLLPQAPAQPGYSAV